MLAPEDTRVLVVEDNPLDRKLLNVHLTSRGYAPRTATDGIEAWEILEREPESFDVVLLDRSMPRMGGIELLGRMKEHRTLRMVPVILQTSSIAHEDIVEGLRAGAYYYLTKPYDPEMLLEVVRIAATDYAEYRELQDQLRKGLKSLRLLREGVFILQTIQQGRDIAAIMANTCPDPQAAVIGLTELLLNAIEHGNLGITYEEKSVMTTKDEWYGEIERRLALPDNARKRVELRYERDEQEIRFVIRDDGDGFDWRRFFEIEPDRVFDAHGRGIIMARALSFTSLEYRGKGNEVVATISLRDQQ
ncbi:MAG TPA: response regulator [Thermoanaerobaculia bacterium]|nr:response regulator [Thermoanaerobaculia bacterium]